MCGTMRRHRTARATRCLATCPHSMPSPRSRYQRARAAAVASGPQPGRAVPPYRCDRALQRHPQDLEILVLGCRRPWTTPRRSRLAK
jgi:hypothetical protein